MMGQENCFDRHCRCGRLKHSTGMKDTGIFFAATAFLFRNFNALLPFLLLPLLATTALFGALLFASYQLIHWLHTLLALDPASYASQALAVSMQLLGGIITVLLAYQFFIPLWQLMIMPLMEGFILKSCRLYCREKNLVLTEKASGALATFFSSSRIAFAVFARQIIFRIVTTIFIFLNPLFGFLSVYVEILSNIEFAQYEYFHPLFFTYSHHAKNFRELQQLLKRSGIPSLGFKICGSFFLSIPLMNILGIFVNAVAATMLFVDSKEISKQ